MNTYEEIRNQIKDGDLIAVKGTGFISKLIQKVTNSSYSHVAIAMWIEQGLWAYQQNIGGNNLVPLSQFTTFDVYACPVDPGEICRSAALDSLRICISYSFLDCLFAGITALTKLQIPATRTGQQCATTVTLIYTKNGWVVDNIPKIPTPGWIAGVLKLKFSVTNP